MPKKYFFPPPKIRINKLVFTLQRTLFAEEKALCNGKSSVSQERLCATKNRHNYPKNSAQAEFLCFCVFAGKNAVYLANQSCKDGESKALCTEGKSSVPQKTGITIPRIRHKPNSCAFAQGYW